MPNSGPAVVALRDIVKSFSGAPALQGVSFSVESGRIHALVGENGAGKSTLIKILSGVWPYGSFAGSVELSGAEARFYSVQDAQSAGVAVIHQELALVPELTAAQNIFLGHESARWGLLDERAAVRRSQKIFEDLQVAFDVSARVEELGVGERQLVEIAKAMSRDFKVLILDEPTAALSEFEARRLSDLLRKLKARGKAIIYISHRLKDVLDIADKVTVLRDGKSVGAFDRSDVDENRLIESMVGRKIDRLFPRRSRKPGKVRLQVDGARARLAGDATPFSFSVREAEILGIAGLVGSGRTELLEFLFGVTRGGMMQGKIRLDGAPLTVRSPEQAKRLGIALVTENRKDTGLVVEHGVRPNLTLASMERFSRAGFVRCSQECKAAEHAKEEYRVKTTDIETPVETLSGGNQQKVVIAKWLMRQPLVMLMDEPTRGVDVATKSEIYERIARLADEGTSVIVVSSELMELRGLCDRILTLCDGKITAEFPAETGEEKLMKAMMGAAHV